MMEQSWNCPQCLSRVDIDIYPCPNCKVLLPQLVVPIPKPPSKIQNKCPSCTFSNAPEIQECQICGNKLPNAIIPAQHPLPDLDSKKSTITCKACHQENAIYNEACVFCQEDLFEQKKIQCEICHQKVKAKNFDSHHVGCLLSLELLKEEEKQLKRNQEECVHCHQKFDDIAIKAHEATCIRKGQVNLEVDQKTRMTKLQIAAIHYMHSKSQKEHNTVKSALQLRVKKLGYSIQDLNNLQYYVENYAPIIIHIHVSKHMQFFVKDTHYRSQFETNKSSGSLSRASRTTWEDRMFDKKYSNAKDFERVKYGVVNFTNDPKGVSSCVGYGNSYFLLKEHVRQRCTFTDKDSSASDASIATFKYCFKILSKMNDAELKAAFNASKAIEVSSACTTAYKEIQVHGPVEFSKDIERIYVNRNEIKDNKKLLDMVYEFSKINKVEYDFF